MPENGGIKEPEKLLPTCYDTTFHVIWQLDFLDKRSQL